MLEFVSVNNSFIFRHSVHTSVYQCQTAKINIKKESSFMKKLTVKKGSECMACLQCVQACSEAFYKEFHEDKSCIQIVEKKSIRPMVCPQCGKCAEACPAGAIFGTKPTNDGERNFDPDKCSHYMKEHFQDVGRGSVCGICIKVCPKNKL